MVAESVAEALADVCPCACSVRVAVREGELREDARASALSADVGRPSRDRQGIERLEQRLLMTAHRGHTD